MDEIKLPFPDKDGYMLYVPPREPWRKLSEELKIVLRYRPEDDTPLIFRKVR